LLPLCPIYNSIPDPAARARLVAKLDTGESLPHDLLAWRFDIVLRGPRQTYFENRPEGA
jgi:protocatechuate 3,4-dioxygenase beta subunit